MELLEQVVSIEEKMLFVHDANQLISIHALAFAYEADGQTELVVKLMEYTVRELKQTLGEEHTDLLTSQHELAGAYINPITKTNLQWSCSSMYLLWEDRHYAKSTRIDWHLNTN